MVRPRRPRKSDGRISRKGRKGGGRTQWLKWLKPRTSQSLTIGVFEIHLVQALRACMRNLISHAAAEETGSKLAGNRGFVPEIRASSQMNTSIRHADEFVK